MPDEYQKLTREELNDLAGEELPDARRCRS